MNLKIFLIAVVFVILYYAFKLSKSVECMNNINTKRFDNPIVPTTVLDIITIPIQTQDLTLAQNVIAGANSSETPQYTYPIFLSNVTDIQQQKYITQISNAIKGFMSLGGMTMQQIQELLAFATTVNENAIKLQPLDKNNKPTQHQLLQIQEIRNTLQNMINMHLMAINQFGATGNQIPHQNLIVNDQNVMDYNEFGELNNDVLQILETPTEIINIGSDISNISNFDGNSDSINSYHTTNIDSNSKQSTYILPRALCSIKYNNKHSLANGNPVYFTYNKSFNLIYIPDIKPNGKKDILNMKFDSVAPDTNYYISVIPLSPNYDNKFPYSDIQTRIIDTSSFQIEIIYPNKLDPKADISFGFQIMVYW